MPATFSRHVENGYDESLRPRFAARGPVIAPGATYVGLGRCGSILSVVFTASPPARPNLYWIRAELMNRGDNGR